MRDPYLPAGQPQAPLGELFQRLPGGRLAYTAAAARLVIDQYRAEGGAYHLQLSSFPMSSCAPSELDWLGVTSAQPSGRCCVHTP